MRAQIGVLLLVAALAGCAAGDGDPGECHASAQTCAAANGSASAAGTTTTASAGATSASPSGATGASQTTRIPDSELGRLSCDGFATRAAAVTALQQGAAQLDPDRNGIPCENTRYPDD